MWVSFRQYFGLGWPTILIDPGSAFEFDEPTSANPCFGSLDGLGLRRSSAGTVEVDEIITVAEG